MMVSATELITLAAGVFILLFRTGYSEFLAAIGRLGGYQNSNEKKYRLLARVLGVVCMLVGVIMVTGLLEFGKAGNDELRSASGPSHIALVVSHLIIGMLMLVVVRSWTAKELHDRNTVAKTHPKQVTFFIAGTVCGVIVVLSSVLAYVGVLDLWN